LIAVCATLARLIHEHWYLSAVGRSLFESPANRYAPETYRVAIPALGRLVVHSFHLSNAAAVAAAMDFWFAFFALYLLYRLLDTQSADTPNRPAAVGLFLAFLCFPIMWVVPWMRIETVPTAFYLASALSLICQSARRAWCTWVLLALTVWQGFVRFDVPFVLGVALVFVSLTKTGEVWFGSRLLSALRGMAMAFLAVMVQLYLQRVRYPNARYEPKVPIIKLGVNLEPHNLASLLLALLPVFLIAGVFLIKRPRLNAMDLLTITASALYLPLWLTVGLAAEVRIYVPFLMALSVVAARICSTAISAEHSLLADEVSRPEGSIAS
jgi:hypothetical protein